MSVQSYFVVSMDLFRSEYGLQGDIGFISCQDPSSDFFRFIIAVIYYCPYIFKSPDHFNLVILNSQCSSLSKSPVLHHCVSFISIYDEPNFFCSLFQFTIYILNNAYICIFSLETPNILQGWLHNFKDSVLGRKTRQSPNW